MFQEVFAGGKQLTASMRRNKRWIVNVPIDCHSLGSYRRDMDLLKDDVLEELLRKARRPRQYWHLGIPCDSFSIANVNMNAGTRSSDLPEGNGSLAREILGNELLSRGLRIIRALEDAGNYWSVENPQSSYLFKQAAVERLRAEDTCIEAVFDQCMYGLKFPDSSKDVFCRKATRVISNISHLGGLVRRCDRNHLHEHAIGSVWTHSGWQKRTKLAGRYPVPLCQKWAELATLLQN